MNPLLAAALPDSVGAASGAAITAYRDAWVPQVFQPEPWYWLWIDGGLLLACLGLGGWWVVKARPARRLGFLLAGALVHFGLLRGGCLCPVGAVSNVALGAAYPELVGVAEFLLFLLPLVAALLVGRIFCGTACPLGAVQQFMAPRVARHPLPRRLDRALRIVPMIVLVLTVWSAIAGGVFLACRLDAYKPLFFTGHFGVHQMLAAARGQTFAAGWWPIAGDRFAWLFLALLLVCGWVVPRVFCRLLCPYGVLLGVLALLGFRRRRLNAEQCTACQRCVRACPVQAIEVSSEGKPRLSTYACVECNRCTDVCRPHAIR